MTRASRTRDWLPLAKTADATAAEPTGEAFDPAWIDFEHGIRVGNLEPHERITRILRYHLERRYATPFITDRWGRGVYWQWICWLPRANRQAKPVSSHVNFGCAKLFISADRDQKVFKSGLQIERGYVKGPESDRSYLLKPDWDWHRFAAQCDADTALDREMRRLLNREGFVAEIGNWDANAVYRAANFTSARQLRADMDRCPPGDWAGFQLYYPMPERELHRCTGADLVKAVCGVFTEVVPAMNASMQVPLTAREGGGMRPLRA